MNFVAFPVESTNVFPLANSSKGGQLLTEWNLRSRESVDTHSEIEYFIGHSFTHSMKDFEIHSQTDTYNTTISNTSILVTAGRALVNGHFVESLEDIVIDLNDANIIAAKENVTPLKGELSIGLKVQYSNYQTMAGSALVENDEEYYEGVQVVIVPTSSLKLPEDVPGENQWNKSNMDLLLGTFRYRNGAISSVKQNSHKIESLDAERISNIDEILGDMYLKRTNLDPNKLYTMSGKSIDGTSTDGRETWCDSTDSLMIWDNNPNIATTVPSKQSYFEYNSLTNKTNLVVAHKQVDGMTNTGGQSVYYQDKVLALPEASFESSTGGVVTPAYTKNIKDIKEKLDLFYRLPNGRMRQYIDVLNDRDDLPEIPVSRDSRWPYSQSEYASDISSIRADIASMKQQLDELEDGLSTKIQSAIQDYAGTYFSENLSSSISSIQSSIDSIGVSIDSLDARVTKLEEGSDSSEDVSALKARVDALEKQVASLITQVNDMSNTITSEVSSAKSSLETTIKSRLEAAITTLNNNFNGLSTSLTSSITNLQSTLTSFIEARVQEALDSRSIFTTWTWSPGDYVLVGQDNTVGATVSGRAPTTMYVVGPSYVTSVVDAGTITTSISTASGQSSTIYQRAYQTMLRTVPQSLAGGVEIASAEISSSDQASPSLWDVSAYRGAPYIDYFVARMKVTDSDTQTETWTCYFYTPNMTNARYDYEEPVWVTGGVPLATEDTVGGFVNVPSTALGGGYVYRDDSGYLKLLDYELLLTGVLAYQLGENYSEGAGLALIELQSILDEEINDRIAFPNNDHKTCCEENDENPNVIHLYLDVPDDSGTLYIHDIGSRYGTSLYVHINGSATDQVNIIFQNCDKLRIDGDISGAPNIYLDNVNLFYDANVLDAAVSISNLTLWYERYESTDPNLQVDGMTVTLLGRMETSENFDPWDDTYANDNHYAYALRSLTFGSDGSIINIGMLVSDSTTANIDEGRSAFATTFTLPQSVGIGYPSTRMTNRIKVTGSFVSHYVLPDNSWMMKQTEFSAITQKYNALLRKDEVSGTISFLTDAFILDEINGVDPDTTVDGWDLNTPHYFTGGVVE